MSKSRHTDSIRRAERFSLLLFVLCAFVFVSSPIRGQEVRVLYDSNEQHKIAVKEAAAAKEAERLAAEAPSVVVSMSDDEDYADDSDADAAALILSTVEADAPESDTPLFSTDAEPTTSKDVDDDASAEEPSSDMTTKTISGQEYDVLIDMRHAYDFSDFPLTLDDRYYHRIYSFHRGFELLRSRGYKVGKYDSEAPITPEALSRCQTLFLNLPSADKAPFLVSEILAIRDFVTSGGSLVLITDHTNCYFHQTCLTPLFHELDIHPQHYSVCDAQHALGSSGFGWIYVNRFESSPVTHGLREIAMQTGGGVDPRFAVAWSGDESWQDSPNLPVYGEADVAFFGNFTRDADEPAGSSGVVLAKKFGRGKIVIIGDQNLFSAFFLQYLDVYRLWLNTFAWACGAPEPHYGAAAAAKDAVNADSPESEDPLYNASVVCWEDLRPSSVKFGDPDADGYYHLYTTLCRRYSPFCVAHDDPNLNPAVLIILNGGVNYQPESFALAYRQLQRGKRVVVVDPADDALTTPESEVAKLLAELKANDQIATEPDQATADNNPNPVESAEPRGRRFAESFVLSNGGELILVRGEDSYRNSIVPKPEGRVTLHDQENLDRLLQCVEAPESSK